MTRKTPDPDWAKLRLQENLKVSGMACGGYFRSHTCAERPLEGVGEVKVSLSAEEAANTTSG